MVTNILAKVFAIGAVGAIVWAFISALLTADVAEVVAWLLVFGFSVAWRSR
ncbi:hypothetical protein PQU92_08140 [Asticcacaulis sp. BYS171W]|uniref:Uncharacterized protein n=1 Tax=Asticcacaulis aquaticus TaxID=2984212 RepID=A0ABT5HTF1_9CAUL|nr:hypothetical protein [Asticcacaulis aquaticus]MDC7683243.1 hypothetical protein [Asticcacaulis aquaticus]